MQQRWSPKRHNHGSWVLTRAAFIANQYDRNAQEDVRYNMTDRFHLCGLIERAASLPKSGATHRRNMDSELVDAAKALFCRTHGVAHPSTWEWEEKRTCDQVREALLLAADYHTVGYKAEQVLR